MWTAEDSKIFFHHRFCLAEVSLSQAIATSASKAPLVVGKDPVNRALMSGL
jgi:hypothetical protein